MGHENHHLTGHHHQLLLSKTIRFPIRGGGHGGQYVRVSRADGPKGCTGGGGPRTLSKWRGGPQARNEALAAIRRSREWVGAHQGPQPSLITIPKKPGGSAFNAIGSAMVAQCMGRRTITSLVLLGALWSPRREGCRDSPWLIRVLVRTHSCYLEVV
jgi:hypothetical protein